MRKRNPLKMYTHELGGVREWAMVLDVSHETIHRAVNGEARTPKLKWVQARLWCMITMVTGWRMRELGKKLKAHK
jgi:hypothetical protein